MSFLDNTQKKILKVCDAHNFSIFIYINYFSADKIELGVILVIQQTAVVGSLKGKGEKK